MNSGRRKRAIRLLALGCLALLAAAGLWVLQGLFLMDYEDRAYGEWDWARADTWLGSMAPVLRALFWISVVAPLPVLMGAATLIGLGVYRLRREDDEGR